MLKIKHNDGNTLHFSVTPIAIWLFGLLFSAIGALVIIFLTENVILNCDRRTQPEPACQLKTLRVLSSTTQSIPLRQIVQADIESSRSSKGDTYRTILWVNKAALSPVTPSTLNPNLPVSIPLSMAYSSGYNSHIETANQINTFLNNPNQTTFTTQISFAWVVILFGGIFFLVGPLVIAAAPKVICIMNHRNNSFRFEKRQIWGKTAKEIQLIEVLGPRIDTSHSSRGSETLRLGIELNSGEVLWFSGGYDNINNREKYRIADLISDFLGQARF